MLKRNSESKLRNIFANAHSHIPTFLTVVATITITYYLLLSYNTIGNWWFLPSFAGIAGLSALILTAIAKRFKPFWSIVSTGWAILLLQSISNILPFKNFTNVFFIVLAVALFTEFALGNFSKNPIGELLLDIVLCWLITNLYIWFEASILSVLCILILIYILVIVLNLNISLSLKKDRDITDVDYEEIDDTDE